MAAILGVLEGIEGGGSLLEGNQNPITAGVEVTLHWAVIEERVAHDSLTAGGTDEVAAEANQAPGRNNEFQLCAAVVGVFHVLHLAFTDAQLFNAGAH